MLSFFCQIPNGRVKEARNIVTEYSLETEHTGC